MERKPTMDAARALLDAAIREANEWVTSADKERLRRIARKVCRSNGHDPDLVVMGMEGQPASLGAFGTICLAAPIRPQWVLFLGQAQMMVDLMDKGEGALPKDE